MRQTLVEQVDNALRNSFAAIKQDMQGIQASINTQAQEVRDMKANLEQFRESSVTTDKLNLVKIKLGELNEHLKRLWTIEEHLKNLESKLVSKQFVNQQVDTVVIRLAELRNRIDAVAKLAVSESQMKALISDFNRELNVLKSDVTTVRNDRNILDPKLLEKVAFKLNTKIEGLRGEVSSSRDEFRAVIADLRKTSKEFVTGKQIGGLIEDINVEFDRVKEVLKHNSDAIDSLRADIMKSAQVPTVNLDPVFTNIDNLKRDITELRGSAAKETEFKSVSKDMRALENKVQELRSMAKQPVVVEQKPSKFVSKSSKSSGKQPGQIMEALVEQKKKKQPSRKTMFFGNLFISLGVISIVVSLASYFMGLLDLSDKLAVGGVGTFIFGLLLRVIAAIRRKSIELVE